MSISTLNARQYSSPSRPGRTPDAGWCGPSENSIRCSVGDAGHGPRRAWNDDRRDPQIDYVIERRNIGEVLPSGLTRTLGHSGFRRRPARHRPASRASGKREARKRQRLPWPAQAALALLALPAWPWRSSGAVGVRAEPPLTATRTLLFPIGVNEPREHLHNFNRPQFFVTRHVDRRPPPDRCGGCEQQRRRNDKRCVRP